MSADALATLETAVMKTPTYFGELVHRWVSGPFQLTESLFRGRSALPTHSHESPYFTFTLQGSYRERFGTRWRLCTPGTGVGHPAQEAHSQVFDREPTLLMRLAFDGLASDEPLTLAEAYRRDEPALNAHTLATARGNAASRRFVGHDHRGLGLRTRRPCAL